MGVLQKSNQMMTKEINYSIQVPLGTNENPSQVKKRPTIHVTWHITNKNESCPPAADNQTVEMEEDKLSILMKTLNQIQGRIDFLQH